MIKERLGGAASGRTFEMPGDFNFAFGIAVLTVLLQTVALTVELCRVTESHALTSGTVPRLLVLIEICLSINVVGLWLRKPTGLLLSLAALLGAGVSYAAWYVYSRQILGFLSPHLFYQLHPEAVPPHPFGLVGGTWLNLLVLGTSVVLLIWEAKTLRGMSWVSPTKVVKAM